jgi:peptidoglycan/LPS O-acetylase OafA/YrhL
MVYWQHNQVWARVGYTFEEGNILENAFGYQGKYFFATLPAVRTFFTGGHFAVSTFFVISGYVLPARSLGMIQARDYSKLEDNIASALFRRWLRLYIPCVVTTLVYMTSWHAFGVITAYPPHQESWLAELWNWYKEFKNFSFVFRASGDPWFTYNFHLWSIPVEFRGSIVIYTTLMAVSRASRNARLLTVVGLIFYFMYVVNGWCYCMFLGGMLICDLELLAKNKDLPGFFSIFKPYKQTIFYTMFGMSVLLSGVPSAHAGIDLMENAPVWRHLLFLKPAAMEDFKWFYLFWAATFFIASIPNISWLKSFFELPFCQYLGRISFSLYLVHGPILWSLGDRIYLAVGWVRDNNMTGLEPWMGLFPLPRIGPYGLEPRFLLPHLILLPVTLWSAEIVTRLCDEPSNRFPQWLYKKLLAPRPGK